MTDVITVLNYTYVEERAACEWVQPLILKKDLYVRLATKRIERVNRMGSLRASGRANAL